MLVYELPMTGQRPETTLEKRAKPLKRRQRFARTTAMLLLGMTGLWPAIAAGISPAPRPLPMNNYRAVASYFPAAASDGRILAVGAQANALGMVGEHPMVVVWQWRGDDWNLLQALTTNLQPFEEFATAVAVRENVIAVGAPGTMAGDLPRGGSVYIYQRTPGEDEEFFEAQRIVSPQTTTDGRFGASVAFCGPYLVIGAPGESGREKNSVLSRGAIYVYRASDSPGRPWKQVERITPETPEEARSYGSTIAATEDWVVIGDPNACESESDPWRGRVHILRRTSAEDGESVTEGPVFEETGLISLKSGGSGLRLGRMLAVTEGRIAIGCEMLNPEVGEITPRILILEVAQEDSLQVTHQQVLALPPDVRLLASSQISLQQSALAVLTRDAGDFHQHHLHLFRRENGENSDSVQWAKAAILYPPHLPIFGENPVTLDHLTLFARGRLLTVLRKTTRGGGGQHALTALVSYSAERLLNWGQAGAPDGDSPGAGSQDAGVTAENDEGDRPTLPEAVIRPIDLAREEFPEGPVRLKIGQRDLADSLGASLLEIPGALVAGAPGGQEEGTVAGRVIVLPRESDGKVSTTGWELRISAKNTADAFGEKVVYHDGWLAVSAPLLELPQQSDPGAVALFQVAPGSAPVFHSLVSAPSGYEVGRFGADVALAEGLLFVGAPGQTSGRVLKKPRVLIFRSESTQNGQVTWEISDTLEDPQDHIESEFGAALGIEDDLLAVGAPSGFNEAGETSGVAYLYGRHRQGRDRFGLIRQITAAQAGPLARFGSSFALSEDSLYVGAPAETVQARRLSVGPVYNRNQGAVYEFQRDFPSIGGWGQTSRIHDEHGRRSQNFGVALALEKPPHQAAKRLWIGAPGTMVGDPDVSGGAIIAFEQSRQATLAEPGEWRQVGRIISPEPVVRSLFGLDFTVSNGNLVAGALRTSESSMQRGGGLYIYPKNLLQNSLTNKLPIPGQIPDQELPSPGTDPAENPDQDKPTPQTAREAGEVVYLENPPLKPWRLYRLKGVPGVVSIADIRQGLLLTGEIDPGRESRSLFHAELPDPAPGAVAPCRRLINYSVLSESFPRTYGDWAAYGDETAAQIHLLHLSSAPGDPPFAVEGRNVVPRKQREGLGRYTALKNSFLAMTDVDGVSVYRIIGGQQGAAIFESRLNFSEPLASPPKVGVDENVLAVLLTGSDSKGVAVAEVRIFPKTGLRFQAGQMETVLLPLEKAASANDLRLTVAGDSIFVAMPEEARGFLLRPGEELRGWEATHEVKHTQADSHFGAVLLSDASAIFAGAPGADEGRGGIYRIDAQSPGGSKSVQPLLNTALLPENIHGAGSGLALESNTLFALATLRDTGEPAILTRSLLANLELPRDQKDAVTVSRVKTQLIPSRDGAISQLDSGSEKQTPDDSSAADASARADRDQDSPELVVTRESWKMYPVPGKVSEKFGTSLCAGDGHLFVGDPGERSSSGSAAAGCVWYLREVQTETGASAWETVGRVSDPDPQVEGFFGASLAFHGQHLAIGAPGKNAVLIVRVTDDGRFQPVQRIDGTTDLGEQAQFGKSVMFVGDQLLISAPSAEVAQAQASPGAVLVFQRSAGQDPYTAKGRLALPAGVTQAQAPAHFGQALVAQEEDLILVGAPGYRDPEFQRLGTVFAYHLSSLTAGAENGWDLVRTFSADREIGSTQFAATLSAAGEFLAIGAPEADMLDVSRPGRVQRAQGAVHLYRKRGLLNDWIALQVLTAKPGQENARFGSSLALDDNGILAANAPGLRNESNGAGKVFYFWKADVLSSGWKASEPLAPDDPGKNRPESFGSAVLIHDNSLICTGRGSSESGVYVYPLDKQLGKESL